MRIRWSIAVAVCVVVAASPMGRAASPVSFTTPEQGGIYPRSEFTSIEGNTNGSEPGDTGHTRVALIKRMKDDSCRHFNGKRFVRDRCGAYRWLAVEPHNCCVYVSWTWTLPSDVRLADSVSPDSRVRRYEVRASYRPLSGSWSGALWGPHFDIKANG